MPQLKKLNLDKTKVTDCGVARIANLPALEFLHLGRTCVTDECVPDLLKMKSLKKLHVTRTQITPEGAARLTAGLPQCEVIFEVEE